MPDWHKLSSMLHSLCFLLYINLDSLCILVSCLGIHMWSRLMYFRINPLKVVPSPYQTVFLLNEKKPKKSTEQKMWVRFTNTLLSFQCCPSHLMKSHHCNTTSASEDATLNLFTRCIVCVHESVCGLCWCFILPLNSQFLIGGLQDVNKNFLVHSCTQLEALLVFVFCYSTGYEKTRKSTHIFNRLSIEKNRDECAKNVQSWVWKWHSEAYVPSYIQTLF